MATPPVFYSGDVLTAAQMNSVGLWLVKSQTVGTAVSSVAVTDAFNADYDNYKIIYSGGVGNTPQAIIMVLGASTASYYQTLHYVSYATAAVTTASVNNGGSWGYIGEASTSQTLIDIDITNPYAAKFTQFAGPYIGSGIAGTVGGYHGVANSYTGFTLSVAGNITGGTISVYGYRKA